VTLISCVNWDGSPGRTAESCSHTHYEALRAEVLSWPRIPLGCSFVVVSRLDAGNSTQTSVEGCGNLRGLVAEVFDVYVF